MSARGAVDRLGARCLAILAETGGEATATEIRRRLEAGGATVTPNRVSDAMRALARRDPPAVTAEDLGGWGRSRLWRLAEGAELAPGEDAQLPWELSRNVARNARRLRLAKGLQQGDVARAAGMAQPTLSGYEREAARIPADRARALAVALGVTADVLTGGTS